MFWTLRGDRVDRGIRGDLARWLYNRGPVVDLDYVGITMRNAIGSEFGLFPVHRLCRMVLYKVIARLFVGVPQPHPPLAYTHLPPLLSTYFRTDLRILHFVQQTIHLFPYTITMAYSSTLLTNKVGIVTGAGSPFGIGRSLVMSLALAGAKAVYATDLTLVNIPSLQQEVKDAGSSCQVHGAILDVTSEDQTVSVLKEIIATYGRLDFYFANAGFGNYKYGQGHATSRVYAAN